jgi:hypothetical protein
MPYFTAGEIGSNYKNHIYIRLEKDFLSSDPVFSPAFTGL